MQKPKPFRRRAGASAEFARAMAKAEFGRHYVSDTDLDEVRRSLSAAKARRTPATTSKKTKGDRG